MRLAKPLLGALDFFNDKSLDRIADLDILEAVDAKAALVAILHGLHVILEAAHAGERALEYDRTIANNTHLVVAVELAFEDIATGNRADFGNLEHLSDLGCTDIDLRPFRTEHSFHGCPDIVHDVVDDVVLADLDFLCIGSGLCLRCRSDVESDDKSRVLRSGCQVDIVLDDCTGCGTDDPDADLGCGELLKSKLEGLDRTLDITFDDDVEFLDLAFLDGGVETC